MNTEHTGWPQPLIVTLTATSNPYLTDRLPLQGLLQVHEMRTDHHAQPFTTSFRELDSTGTYRAPVAVDHAQFTYTGPTAL